MNAARAKSGSCPRQAFTLVEMLVAMGILSIIVVFVMSLVNSVVFTTMSSSKRIDADGNARLVLDRMAFDVEKMLIRADLDYSFLNSGLNDSCAFYTAQMGYSGNTRAIAIVNYQINPNFELERGTKAIDWNNTVFSGTNNQSLTSRMLPPPDPDDCQVLSDAVFRYKINFWVRNDLNALDQKLEVVPPARIKNLTAIVVSIAVLDERSRRLLLPGQLTSLAQAFPDAVDNWASIAARPIANIPKSASANIRVYQRTYYIQ